MLALCGGNVSGYCANGKDRHFDLGATTTTTLCFFYRLVSHIIAKGAFGTGSVGIRLVGWLVGWLVGFSAGLV